MIERIWAELDKATVYMDGSSPVVARDREFPKGIEYVRSDIVDKLLQCLSECAKNAEEIRLTLINHLNEPERQAFWKAVLIRDSALEAARKGTKYDPSTQPYDEPFSHV